MSFVHEKRVATRMIDALENATLDTDDVRPLLEEADPALVYFLFAWLRAHYPASHSASDGVLGRIVEVCRQSPTVARMAKAGEKDAIVQWFEESYDYREMSRTPFIDLIVDKLEG